MNNPLIYSTNNRNGNPETQRWQEMDAVHHLHPFSDAAALNAQGSRVITKGDGVYLYDGKRLGVF